MTKGAGMTPEKAAALLAALPAGTNEVKIDFPCEGHVSHMMWADIAKEERQHPMDGFDFKILNDMNEMLADMPIWHLLEAAPDLAAAYIAQAEENKRLREALEVYAKEEHWTWAYQGGKDPPGRMELLTYPTEVYDGWEIARAALESVRT